MEEKEEIEIKIKQKESTLQAFFRQRPSQIQNYSGEQSAVQDDEEKEPVCLKPDPSIKSALKEEGSYPKFSSEKRFNTKENYPLGESLVVIEKTEPSVRKVEAAVQVSTIFGRSTPSHSDESPPRSNKLTMIPPLLIVPPLPALSSTTPPNIEGLAKEEYKKWGEVRSMLRQIGERLDPRYTKDVRQLFSKLDAFAKESKKELRDEFIKAEQGFSGPVSEARLSLPPEPAPVEVKDQGEQVTISSVKSKPVRRRDIEIWPEAPPSPSGSPKSFYNGTIWQQREKKNVLLSDRTPIASKIKVIDLFEAKADQPIKPLQLQKSISSDLHASDLSRSQELTTAILKESQIASDRLSLLAQETVNSKPGMMSPRTPRDYPTVPPLINMPEPTNEVTPPRIEEKTPDNSLKNYIETQASQLNWLVGDNPAELSGEKRDASFEREVASCRKQFLAETLTEHVLNELLSEFKKEIIYFRRPTFAILDDPRFASDSSEEETVYGIRTNMNAVFEYCNLLVRFLSDNYLDLLLTKFNSKQGQNKEEVLNQIKARELTLAFPATTWDNPPPLSTDFLIPDSVFESLESEIISNYESMNIMQSLFDMQRIYHKSIFDCLNEVLTQKWRIEEDIDYYKVVVHGKQHISRIAVTADDLLTIFNSAKDTVVEYATMMCGLIRDKEDSLLGNVKMMAADKVDMIREERLFRLLCLETIESEKQFVNYTKDELGAVLECSDTIWDSLLTEVTLDLVRIKNKKEVIEQSDLVIKEE